MAGKPLNRLELRRQNDAAEPLDPMEDEADESMEDFDDDEATEKRPKKKAKAPAKSKAKSTKAAKPATRTRIVWVVTNDAFKPVGTFEYSQREAADARAAELTAKGKGSHFVQKVKEPMPDNAPGLGASIPRTPPAPVAAVTKEAAAAVDDDEEIEEEEETDGDMDEEVEDDE